MIASLVLMAQMQVTDSVYGSSALRTLVADAARRNRNLPGAIWSFGAVVETEIAVVLRQREGIEAPLSLEQLSSDVRWKRPGDFEQHVTGYRMRTLGPQFSSLGFFRQAFLVPHLYGNRLLLLFGPDSGSRGSRTRKARDPLVAIHPLADDRDRAYRFSGGDTVVTLKVGGRTIPIARVMVEPRPDAPPHLLAFYGELDIDITRQHIVRMRGRFVTPGIRRTALGRLSAPAMEVVAYVELENAEVEEQVWLPSFQRIEGQALFPVATDMRSAYRVVSRFRNYRLNDVPTEPGEQDSLMPRPHKLTMAGGDSLGNQIAFTRSLGEATAQLSVEDFDELAPERWRSTGAPIVTWGVPMLSDLVHINRVEGLFTGIGAELRFRNAAPGLKAQASVGWAWAEETARGHASIGRERKQVAWALRAGRTLDITNDFRIGLDSGSALGAFVGVDDYDYVQRRFVAAQASRLFGARRSAILRGELAAVRDGGVQQRLQRSPLGIGGAFAAIRGVTSGSYVRSIVTLDLQPGVGMGLIKPGLGVRATVEIAAGALRYQRGEVRLAFRHNGSTVASVLRIDAGAVRGNVPPQQLFEVGSTQGLPGYEYKEFGGTEAALVRAVVTRPLPILRAPMRFMRRFLVPGISPGLAAGIHGAWVGEHNPHARNALELLSGLPPSTVSTSLCDEPPSMKIVSVPTCGWRATASFGVRFFGGAIGIDLARAIDRRAPWKLVLGGGEF